MLGEWTVDIFFRITGALNLVTYVLGQAWVIIW